MWVSWQVLLVPFVHIVLAQLHTCRDYRTHPIDTSRGTAHLLFMYADMRADAGYVDMVVMLTSLVELRSCPIHLHFAVDQHLQSVLNATLHTHNISHLKHSYYSDAAIVEAQQVFESELPARDISIRKELQKASPELLPLPKEANKILMLDFDIMFIRDICTPYFELVDGLKDAVAFLAPDASGHYVRSKKQAAYLMPSEYKWQSSYNGFHTGVIMLQLDKMRESNWTKRYTELVFHPSRFPQVFLRNKDQAIYNMMRRETSPPLVRYMSPSMNFQMCTKEWRSTYVANFGIKNITILHGSRGAFRRENIILGKLRDLFFYEDGGVQSKALCYSTRTNISSLIYQSVLDFGI